MSRKSAFQTDPDAELVAAVRKGNLDAFESLVAGRQKRMLNIAYRIVGDYDEACEVTQDAFVSAFRNLGSFRGDALFSTWLTSIVINLARNRLKHVKGRQRHEAYSLDTPVETADGGIMPDPPSREPSILDALELKDRQKAVRHCISVLEPEFREAIVLRDLQEFSYEEIGEILSVPQGTVKSRLSRARETVKECLKKTWGER